MYMFFYLDTTLILGLIFIFQKHLVLLLPLEIVRRKAMTNDTKVEYHVFLWWNCVESQTDCFLLHVLFPFVGLMHVLFNFMFEWNNHMGCKRENSHFIHNMICSIHIWLMWQYKTYLNFQIFKFSNNISNVYFFSKIIHHLPHQLPYHLTYWCGCYVS